VAAQAPITVGAVLRLLAAGYAALLLVLGTQPSHPERSSVGFLETVLHLTAGQAAAFRLLVDLAGNVAAYVPLGLLVMAAWRLPWPALASGLLVGGGCELVQLFEPGRVASLTDVLTNTAGGVLGATLLVARSRRAVASRPAPLSLATMPVPVQQP
jgi:VanZ family protein